MRRQTVVSSVCAVAALVFAPVLSAEEPSPTPTAAATESGQSQNAEPAPEVTPTPKPVRLGSGSLGGGGSMGRAQRKDAEGSSVVIDNTNVRTLGEGGTLSVASGGAAPTASAPDEEDAGVPAEVLVKQLMEAESEVDRLERQMQAVDKALEEQRQKNTYIGNGPQNRAGGVQSSSELERQRLEAELAEARDRLSTLEKRVAEAGVTTGAPEQGGAGQPDGGAAE